jgi:hypothetical protein
VNLTNEETSAALDFLSDKPNVPPIADAVKPSEPDEALKKSGTSPPKTKPAKTNTIYSPLKFRRDKITGTAYDYVVGPAIGQWDGWFPRGAPHLVGGPSGGGKSTLVMDMLVAQSHKEVFLGHETFGMSYVILMADRGDDAFERTARRMGFEQKSFPIKFIPATWGESAIHAILDKIESCDEIPAVVFVEGLDGLVEDANKMGVVTPFVDGLRQIAEHYHIAMIGSVGAPKMRIGEGYTAKRDNIFGSGQWARKTETIATMQYVDGDDTLPKRHLTVLPRNAPAEKFFLKMEGGKLVEDMEHIEEKGKAPKSNKFVAWYRAQTDWFSSTDVEEGLNVSQATASRQIKTAWAKNIIKSKQPARGEGRLYRWNDAPNNPELVDAKNTPRPDAQGDENSL